MTFGNRTDEIGHLLAMHLRAAHAHLRRRSNLVFEPLGMTADQYVLLSVLAREGEASQQELVRRCYSDTATIGSMLSLLESKGLIIRTPHPEDGRAWRVRLTGRGRRVADEMKQRSSTLRADMVALFDPDEVETLFEFLERLATAMRPPTRTTAGSRSRKLQHLAHETFY